MSQPSEEQVFRAPYLLIQLTACQTHTAPRDFETSSIIPRCFSPNPLLRSMTVQGSHDIRTYYLRLATKTSTMNNMSA